MKLKLDRAGLDKFIQTTQSDGRFYYVTRAGCLQRAILRIDGCGALSVRDCVVDAQIGWESGVLGFVPEHEVGQQFTKITVRRRLAMWERANRTLSQVLADAPMRAR